MPRKPAAKPALARFANLLAKHLAEARARMAAGEPWTYAAFAAEVTSSREERPRLTAQRVELVQGLGAAGGDRADPAGAVRPARSGRHAEAREPLRKAFQAARAEKNAAVIARAKPDPAGPTMGR